jgi:hypothetical protein
MGRRSKARNYIVDGKKLKVKLYVKLVENHKDASKFS